MMACCVDIVVSGAPSQIRYPKPKVAIGGVELFVCGLVSVLVLELARRRLPAKLLEWFVGRH